MSLRALIVGGDSTIGKPLGVQMERKGFVVTRTSRRATVVGAQNIIQFDLSKGEIPVEFSRPGFDVAILCASSPGLRICREDPVGTRKLNVDSLLRLASRLNAAGTFVIYPSSNMVFDGCSKLPREVDPVNPQTEYGRQKALVEESLLRMGNVAVVRLTKVVHLGLPVIQEWDTHVLAGSPIEAFCDMSCAPLILSEAVRGITVVAARRAHGIWHFSSADDISYLDLAYRFAAARGVSRTSVKGVYALDVLKNVEHFPRFSALDTRHTCEVLGVKFSGIEAIDFGAVGF